ncbi:MAG TPA: penicillin-binding protein 2 [Candidatus Aminicenantes bacterium]|nr:penicillin-binding protein 2 [Candidatus Aminicenantes bacterium]
MPGERIYEDLTLVRRRARAAFWTVAALIVLVLAYYWKVQVFDNAKFARMAEANRTRIRTLAAPRGLVLDRNREILADNRASFKVSLVREHVGDMDAMFASVSRLLGLDEATLRERVELHKDLPLFEPIVVADGLDADAVAPIESRRLEHPELVVESEPQRHYPKGRRAAHVLGYLQERTAEELRAGGAKRMRAGEMVGRAGVERQYDDILRGQDGSVVEVVDSLGRVQYEQAHEFPAQGAEVVLTLDDRLQELAEAALEGREGVVVALAPDSGEVLALASSPTFDPNRFITRFTPAEWRDLINDPLSPLENRAIRGLYAPGSIFKLVMSLGGLAEGSITPATTVYCSGATRIYGALRHCWFEPGHGAMDLSDAIKNSCNIYFYKLGQSMDIDTIAGAARRLGLGRATGIDLAGEKDGLVPDRAWKKAALGEPWFPGETISVAIGQGQLQVTPVQVAALTAAIARRGRPGPAPHLFRSSPKVDAPTGPEAPDGPAAAAAAEPLLPASAFESVIAGMWRSANDGGTGQGARVEGFDVCGKTGSTQVMSRESAAKLAQSGREVKTHSWFSGFAPRERPRLVVTVLVEYGGGGGATAAPVAGRIFARFRELEPR